MATFEISNDGMTYLKSLLTNWHWIELDNALHVAGAVSASDSQIMAMSHTPPVSNPGQPNSIVTIDGDFEFGDLDVITGTVSGFTVAHEGQVLMTATELDVDANEFWLALLSENSADQYRVAFSGDDTMFGSQIGDELNGAAGSDMLFGLAGSDFLVGGSGTDIIRGGKGNDYINGGVGGDTLAGQSGRDSVSGGRGDDDISGGGGSDHLTGGRGNDDLNGNSGNDTLTGGRGDDTLRGGTGTDVFKFSFRGTDAPTGMDVIEDWEAAETIFIRIRKAERSEVELTTSGDDVVISYGEDNQITVEDAGISDVEDAIEFGGWYWYY